MFCFLSIGPPPKEEDEERNNGEGGFPLNIVLPAACVAFFLLLVFMCICFAFRQHKVGATSFSLIKLVSFAVSNPQ